MRAAIGVMTSAVLVSASTSAGASNLFEAIDQAYESGQIGAGERLIYRVAAVRAPERLPQAWRALRPDKPERRCHSDVLIDAFQQLPRLPATERRALRELFDPPNDLAYFVESSTPFPVRVSYATPAEQAKAERILQAVATSYQRQVTEWGFWPPLVEAGAEPFRFYIMNAGGAAGYTSPYAENEATPHADAFTYIVIDPSLSDLQLDATVTHEFNHACQTAMDVAELPSFMENTASYIEIPVYPASLPYAAAMFPYFQSQPYRPLEFRVPGQSDGYEYGGALWPLFLTHQYAAEDPVWIRRVWEETMQQGFVNEPDYFDAIDELIEGGVAEAAERFSEYRFFVGAYDDGQHLPFAGQWGGAEVWTTASWLADQLPVLDAKPTDPSTRPQPNGCNYILFTPDASSEFPVRFSFQGDASFAWKVSLLELSKSAPSNVRGVPVDARAAGQVSIDASALDRVVLMICRAMTESYDPDDNAWLGGDYRYSIDHELPAPTIDSVAPSELETGTHDRPLTIKGSGFIEHEQLMVAASGEKIALDLVDFVSPEELVASVTVAPTAELGTRDLSVTNPGGATATAQGALSIVAPQTVELPSAESGGCACRAGSADRSRWSSLYGLLGLLLLCRRRRASGAGLAAALALLAFGGVAWADPPPTVGYVESARYPLRVYYVDGVDAATADLALGFAEEAWQLQVEDMGFQPSVTEDENGVRVPGLWIYLDPNAAYNHAEPIGNNPDTPHTDCTMRAIIASLGNVSYLETVVGHEMNHALEMSADCGESDFAWENTTNAITVISHPDDPLYATYFLPVFQQYPHHGFDCAFFFDEDKRYFHYGASLFQLFLEDRYGNYDGKLLASIWEAAKQNGNILSVGPTGNMDVPNDPNLLEAMRVVLGATSLEEAVAEFARWRYFVGARDDGQHFTHGAAWLGGEVAIDTALALDQLPIAQGVPVNGLNDFGSAYLELSLLGIDDQSGVTFDFSGDPAVAWSVDALLVKSDGTADLETMELDDAHGSMLLDGLTNYTHAVFVITNLANGAHDPDAVNCNLITSFSYGVNRADLAKPPTLDGVDPSRLTIGESHYVWLSGSNLTAETTVDFGDGVAVNEVSYVDATVLGVALAVRADAVAGPRDVVVTNADGLSAALPQAVTLVGAEQQFISGGCGCTLPGHSSKNGSLALILLLALSSWRRRGHRA